LEVAEERLARFDGDDGAAVLPDSFEERCDQARSFGRILLELPEAAEVSKHGFCLVETGVERWAGPRQLLLLCLPPKDVFALRKIAHHIEIA
jgi:hypothetical protein